MGMMPWASGRKAAPGCRITNSSTTHSGALATTARWRGRRPSLFLVLTAVASGSASMILAMTSRWGNVAPSGWQEHAAWRGNRPLVSVCFHIDTDGGDDGVEDGGDDDDGDDDGDDDDVASSKTLECPEVFDEHAALILHLRSYAMACAWIDPSQQHTRQRKHRTDVAFFRRMMCPWKRRQKRRQPGAGLGRCDLAFVQSGLPIIDSRKGIVYTEIEICDEESVQNLFRNTYGKEYTDKYPAIRKMVKGVLNKDLRKTETITTSMTTTTTTTTTTRNQLGHHNTSSNTNTSDSNIGNSREAIFDGSSNIADCYRSAGGIFLVAIRYTRILVEDGKPDDDDDQSKFRQVVGCVGIRSSDGNADGTLEIFRLAVDIHHRGQGIASNLLRVAEEYARQRQRGRAGNLRFVANTLTILEAATGLYESHGYRAEKETPLGSKLVLRTYAKN
mmetsp:Transcript_24682/g.52285  ORF Transcript_24682/g.52285 Transcript_24682/m.52285 type:complete len:446 (-) Transcript_24682:27-1364(-)